MYSLFTNVHIKVSLLFAHPFQRTLNRDREYTSTQHQLYHRESQAHHWLRLLYPSELGRLGQQTNNRPINKHVPADLSAKKNHHIYPRPSKSSFETMTTGQTEDEPTDGRRQLSHIIVLP